MILLNTQSIQDLPYRLLTGGKILTDYAKKFGFGKATDIELPGEAEGILFNPEDMRPIDVATMSLGQGIAVTPLQMVQAYSALPTAVRWSSPISLPL